MNCEASCYISNMERLKHLSLKECTHVTATGIAEILRKLPGLQAIAGCEVLGEALTVLYDKWPSRHPKKSIPPRLCLQEVLGAGQVSENELWLITEHCADIKKIGLEYRTRSSKEKNTGSHLPDLAPLTTLKHLDYLVVSAAALYTHSLHHVLVHRGAGLVHLELHGVDEVCLDSMVLLGQHCRLLTYLAICNCYYTAAVTDRVRLELACTSKVRTSFLPSSAKPKLQPQLGTAQLQLIINFSGGY